MNILVTGAKGFVGQNLCHALHNIQSGKDRTRPSLQIDEVMAYDLDTDPSQLDDYCRRSDFVIHLAGVNRPKETSEFMEGNFGFSSTLLSTLKRHHNTCPVVLSSSQQASLCGRFGNSEYGRSKKAGEDLFLSYQKDTGSKVLIYRFPNLFGKWCRPNYNSAVATFCHNIANDLPIQVNDPSVELELLYIDDLINEMLDALEGHEHRCEFDGLDVVANPSGRYCYCPQTHKATLGSIVSVIESFKSMPSTLVMPDVSDNSLSKKLFSTYLSYLPPSKSIFSPDMHTDDRGSFTELLKTAHSGQFSVNISNPGITKGQHWHQSKWEIFTVVSGHGLIQQRKIGSSDIIEHEVSGDHIQSVVTIPGYAHNIVNLSETENLVTLVWVNECFDPTHPDTFSEPV